jgi:hypothetical protein
MYTIRMRPDLFNENEVRYVVLRYESFPGTPAYISDWPTLESAKAAVERLSNPENGTQQNPWRS